MVLYHCSFTWILHFWVQLVSCFTTDETPHLPNDVIFNILSRLPHKCVAKCRRVCKKWLELTSTTDFAHTHLQIHCSSTEKVLLLQSANTIDKRPRDISKYDGFFILNKEAKGKRMLRKMLPDLNTPSEVFLILYGSCNGLVIFKPLAISDKNYLFNPTTQERINIRCNAGILFGFFFRPSSKEYILLYRSEARIDDTYKYYLFSLASESLRKVCNFQYSPNTNRQAYSNGVLYWKTNSECDCRNSVMEFHVETELFSSFPHPGKHFGSICTFRSNVFEITGKLLFFRTFSDYIDMWVLEDNKNHIWVKRYSVHLDWDHRLYPFESGDGFKSGATNIRLLNVENGVLLLNWWTRGLFLYNLEKKTIKKVNVSGMKVKGKVVCDVLASCYVKSLVSLKVSRKYPSAGKITMYGRVTIDLE